jgi:hypothetical protein
MYKIVHNIETNEITQEDLSEQDLEEMLLAQQLKAEYSESIASQTNNANKISAVEKLKALGLTEEEAKAIVGIE